LAARFGRLDVAAGHTAPTARKAFLERRAGWGSELRIVDTELAGFDMNESSKATVYIDVAWVRIDEGVVRSTRIAQAWADQDGGWQLLRERRVGGDPGLFGDAPIVPIAPRPDVHFRSKTIR
jgi:hypothetical protein